MLLLQGPLSFRVLSSATLLALGFICLLVYNHGALRPLVMARRGSSGGGGGSTLIPKKIWYKLGPNGLNNGTQVSTDSCIRPNADYEYTFLTDASSDDYVRRTFAVRPDIVDAYLGLRVPILKADFLRYLLLFAEGGVWSDLDVSCIGPPMREWVPARFAASAGLVVGWEFDEGWGDGFERQFATWTIMARPRLPHLAMVIEDIMHGLRDRMRVWNLPIEGLRKDMVGDVVDFTGPRRLTRSVWKSLDTVFNVTANLTNISHLRQPVLVGDVLIMPGYSFANVTNFYPPEEVVGPVLVEHHYAGTWKNDDGGEGP